MHSLLMWSNSRCTVIPNAVTDQVVYPRTTVRTPRCSPVTLNEKSQHDAAMDDYLRRWLEQGQQRRQAQEQDLPICLTDPPSRRDFLPAKHLKPERPAPTDPGLRDLWETGVSVYATEAQARKKAKGWEPLFPLGEHIARLEIPDDAPISVEKTLGRGHYTLRGDPDTLLSHVVSIVLV